MKKLSALLIVIALAACGGEAEDGMMEDSEMMEQPGMMEEEGMMEGEEMMGEGMGEPDSATADTSDDMMER